MTSGEIDDTRDHITPEAVERSATQVVPAGSVLMVVRSGILIRRLPVAITLLPVAINQDMKAFLPSDVVLPAFLAYALQSHSSTILAQCVKKGATVHSVDMQKLSLLRLPLPPPSEQRRIVEILDQADALRKKRAEADKIADRILPALFYKMFGDPLACPKGWEVKSFGVVIDNAMRNGLSPSRSGAHVEDVLTLSAVTGAAFKPSAVKQGTFSHRPGTDQRVAGDSFLICRGNGNRNLVGTAKFADGEGVGTVFPDTIIGVNLEQCGVQGRYLETLWSTPAFRQRILRIAKTTSGIYKVNQAGLATLPIPIPPPALQHSFAAVEKRNRNRSHSANEARQKLHALFAVLLHRAFSGDLTAKWREAHMKELLQEMAQQAKKLGLKEIDS